MASVPPLLGRPVAEQARNAARHFADSGDLGIGQVGKAARILGRSGGRRRDWRPVGRAEQLGALRAHCQATYTLSWRSSAAMARSSRARCRSMSLSELPRVGWTL
jgi:hypothetical protein